MGLAVKRRMATLLYLIPERYLSVTGLSQSRRRGPSTQVPDATNQAVSRIRRSRLAHNRRRRVHRSRDPSVGGFPSGLCLDGSWVALPTTRGSSRENSRPCCAAWSTRSLALLSGETFCQPSANRPWKRVVAARRARSLRRPRPLLERASDEAADGIRTHDLLHGKQTL